MESQPKKTLAGLEILRKLASDGYRTFTHQDAMETALSVGVNQKYTSEALSLLKKNRWIDGLKKGVYAFTPESGLSTPPHDFEVAQAIVDSSAISHWTAMHFYHLTQQTPHIIYSIVPRHTNIPRTIPKEKYRFILIEHFFGIKKVWVEDVQVHITDKERTLLDGLRQPQYCGNFDEVIYAFKTALHANLDIEKIISYSLRLEKAVSKRLGYILEYLGVSLDKLTDLLNVSSHGYNRLNPQGNKKGRCNKRWMIVENR